MAAPRNQLECLSALQTGWRPQLPTPPPPVPSTVRITMREVAAHATAADAWTVVRGCVYDMTPYLRIHPGGEAQLLRVAGRDGTALFDAVHRWVNPAAVLDACWMGMLASPAEEAAAAGAGGGGAGGALTPPAATTPVTTPTLAELAVSGGVLPAPAVRLPRSWAGGDCDVVSVPVRLVDDPLAVGDGATLLRAALPPGIPALAPATWLGLAYLLLLAPPSDDADLSAALAGSGGAGALAIPTHAAATTTVSLAVWGTPMWPDDSAPATVYLVGPFSAPALAARLNLVPTTATSPVPPVVPALRAMLDMPPPSIATVAPAVAACLTAGGWYVDGASPPLAFLRTTAIRNARPLLLAVGARAAALAWSWLAAAAFVEPDAVGIDDDSSDGGGSGGGGGGGGSSGGGGGAGGGAGSEEATTPVSPSSISSFASATPATGGPTGYGQVVAILDSDGADAGTIGVATGSRRAYSVCRLLDAAYEPLRPDTRATLPPLMRATLVWRDATGAPDGPPAVCSAVEPPPPGTNKLYTCRLTTPAASTPLSPPALVPLLRHLMAAGCVSAPSSASAPIFIGPPAAVAALEAAARELYYPAANYARIIV